MTDDSFTAKGLKESMDKIAQLDLDDQPTFTSIFWPFEGRKATSHEPVHLPADFRRILDGSVER